MSRKARPYTRRVSGVERLSLLINEFHHYNVDGVVEGRGVVDPQVFQAAVDRAAEANPAIRVRHRGVLGFARWVDSGIAPRVRVMPAADWDGNSERGAEFLLERLDALAGRPVADILIVPCTDGYTRLVFRTLHAAIDGRGFVHWGAEVFRALRGEPLLGSDSALTDLEVQALYQDRLTTPLGDAPACIPAIAPGTVPPDATAYVWRRVVLNRNVGQLLPKTAAFLAEYARRREPGDIGFTIPIDYRGLRTQEMGIGNLTGYVRLSVPEGASPRLLMRQLQQSIEQFADCRQMPGLNKMRWLPIGFFRRSVQPKLHDLLYKLNPGFPTGGIVSMGKVTAEAHSFPGFVATRVHGIPGAVGKLNLVFLNSDHDVTACFTAPAGYNDQGQLDELVEAYRRHFSSSTEADSSG